MTRTKILAVDPGLLTGLLLVDITDRMNPKKIWSREEETKEFYQLAEETIASNKDELIVVLERFIISARTIKLTQAPWSLKGWGAVEAQCFKYDVPLILQTAGEALEFSTDEKIKAANMWHVGGEGHANDAARHFVKYHSDRSPRWTKTLMI